MSTVKFRIAIFASGNGSNAQAIVEFFRNHPLISVDLILTNNPSAYVIERARSLQVESIVFTREEYREPAVMLKWLKSRRITHIVLAGFLWLIPDYLIKAFPHRIVNIHPSLLPKFGGKGMYGSKVHEAVKASGDTETGITIHEVNEVYDEGKILFQGRCDVHAGYTVAEIAACVQQLEYQHYPVVIEKWILTDAATSTAHKP